MRFSTSIKPLNKFAGIAAALMILPVAVACNNPPDDTAAESTSEEVAAADMGSILEVAAANGSFDTLVAAVQAADLEDTLSGEGPYTVFAPTDEAFEKLPEGTVETLLLEENKEALQAILTYHVIAGEVPASEIESGTVATVAGEDVAIVASDSGVMVNNAMVTTADIDVSNGIIHVIDTVLIPPSLLPGAAQ